MRSFASKCLVVSVFIVSTYAMANEGARCTPERNICYEYGGECIAGHCLDCESSPRCIDWTTELYCVRYGQLCDRDPQGREMNCRSVCMEQASRQVCARYSEFRVCQGVGPSGGGDPDPEPTPTEEVLVNNDHITVKNGADVRIELKDSDTAKAFYEAMTGTSVEVDNFDKKVRRQVSIKNSDSNQSLRFTCDKESDEKYSCELFVKNMKDSAKMYRAHLAKNNKEIFIVRNDTEQSRAIEDLAYAFDGVSTSDVTSGVDPQIGYQIIGGKEFSIPAQEGSVLRLACRSTTEKYFCKFQAKLDK